MIYKTLGNSKERIPAIGFGTCINEVGPSRNYHVLEKTLHECLDAGATFFDTAPVYGDGESEKMLGRLFSQRRNEVFVATKVSPKDAMYDQVIKSAEASLRRLKTETIDLYQIHWPNPNVPIGETMMAMERLVKDGKVRHVGVSNFSLGELKEAQSSAHLNLSTIQVEYNLFDRSIEAELLPYCEKHNISVIGYSPLIQGKMVNGPAQKQMLDKIAMKYNATPAQIVLRWLVENPSMFVIPNTTKRHRIIENLKGANINLTQEDKENISTTLITKPTMVDTQKIRVSSDYNRQAYATIEEARENKMHLSPSPMQLAHQIKGGEFLKTIRLKRLEKPINGKDFDLVEGRLRYWAYIIAHGWNKKIPALIWKREE